MAFGEEKIKEFFEARTEKIAKKIEKTPMERFFLFFLILITISAVVLGYLQMKKNIEQPLADSYLLQIRGQLKEKYGLLNLNAPTASETDMNKLQNQDSDLDGLDDYSEIYIYNTSPYLEDTDGDGIWDKQEILAGTNPNCPEGQTCSAAASTGNSNLNASLPNNLGTDTSGQLINSPLNSGNINDVIGLEGQLISGEITLEQLGINDPEMQKALDQLKTNNPDTSTLSPEEKSSAVDSIKDLTPQQIRDELLKLGFNKAELDQIDDKTLQALFLETLKTY
ncbi:MAG: hypothetical protein NT116_03840 [Candidatus Parcubacteria bacterium]|nr:hypothetical protein [Candidatus Parcubacteria bacterium]